MKSIFKKGLSILLVICLLLTLAPAGILQVQAADPSRSTALDLTGTSLTYKTINNSSVTVNPSLTDITNTGEGWTWYTSTKVLLLNGISLASSDEFAIKLPAGSSIVLASGSSNSVSNNSSSTSGNSYGILSEGGIGISGDGTLNVSGGSAGNSYGIYCDGSFSTAYATIMSSGGNSTENSYGIYIGGDALIYDHANLNATGGTAAAASYGIYCEGKFTKFVGVGVCNATGGNAQSSFGVYGKDADILGGLFNAKSNTNAENYAAIYMTDSLDDTKVKALQYDSTPSIKYFTLPTTLLNDNDDFYYVFGENQTRADNIMYMVLNPSASITKKIISGTVGAALSGPDNKITLTLTDCKFDNLSEGENVTGWFNNNSLPNGLSVSVSEILSDTAVTLEFAGTPAAESDKAMSLDIPTNKLLNVITAVSVDPNGSSFSIANAGQRTTGLDFTVDKLFYKIADGSTEYENPLISDITDSAEGWTWYKNAHEPYAANTLVLDGIDVKTSDAIAIKLPEGSTVALVDGSVNTVRSTATSQAYTYGIYSIGSLIVKGRGTLTAAGGSESTSISAGIAAEGNLTIASGIINASAGRMSSRSVGIYSPASVSISGGTVTAFGAINTSESYGIYAGNTAVFSGGTTYVKSDVIGTTSYSVYAASGIQDNGMIVLERDMSMNYTIEAAKTNRNNAWYYASGSGNIIAKDTKIVKNIAASATVSDKTLTGMIGTAFIDSDTITIELTDCTFENLSSGDNVSSWFSNLPAGLSVLVSEYDTEGRTSATLKFTGIPTAASSAAMTITIPDGNLSTDSNLEVTSNESARFDIAAAGPLDLTVDKLYYKKIGGGIGKSNPSSTDITNAAEGWTWYKNANSDYSANTLVLNGINIESPHEFAIKLPAGATIVLADGSDNVVKSIYDGNTTYCYGIYGLGDLEIKGSTGTLSVEGGTTSGSGSFSSAITSDGDLHISGGIVEAIGGTADNGSYGIMSWHTAAFSGGTIYAKSSSASNSYAVLAIEGLKDYGMTAFQKHLSHYTEEAKSIRNTDESFNYVYGTDPTTADDIKITSSFTGTGTELDPYLIYTPSQLKEVSDCVNNVNNRFGNKHYKLMNNIVLNPDVLNNPEEWIPIGTDSDEAFSGLFDGNGHTISGLYMNGDAEYSGLFGYIQGGTVKGVGLIAGSITSDNDYTYAGGIAGVNESGTIEDCYNTGSVKAAFVGGIVGSNRGGHIQDCYNTGWVQAPDRGFVAAGGIAGENSNAEMTVVNCYNTGNVTVSVTGDGYSGFLGGIAGRNMESSIKNCYSTGTLSGTAAEIAHVYVGGISGNNFGDTAHIENAYWLAGTAQSGIGVESSNTGCTAMSEEAMKAQAFVDTLNDNADALKTTYSNLSSWKSDNDHENSGYPLFGTAEASYTLTLTDGGTGAAAGGSYPAGTVVPISAGTKSGYRFNGWTSSGGGSFANANQASTTFTMPGANVTITANWTVIPPVDPPNDDTPDSSSGGSNPAPGNTGGNNSTDVIVNGQVKSAGTTDIDTGSDGKTVTTVTVNSDKLEALLAAENKGSTVVIPFAKDTSVAVGKLTGEMIQSMESKDATLIIQTPSSSYRLPASEINIAAVSKQLGANVALSDITISVSIQEPSAAMAKVVENTGKGGGFTIMAPSVDFTINGTYGQKTIDISSFNFYVERLIAIPEGVDPSKITTGVVVKPDGTVYHVPTQVTVIDGKYYAVINSLTNSTYSVIWNPIEFADVTHHWAKNSINNMGSRKVVTGIGNNSYNPDVAITRAEFAAIIVRGLGLEPQTGSNSFKDVDSSKWYSGYIKTAVSYGIVKGYSEDTFGPQDTITREQAITMIGRAMKITRLNADINNSEITASISAYLDGSKVAAYAQESMAACLKASIVYGRAENRLAPKEEITRAETAVMVERLLQKSELIDSRK